MAESIYTVQSPGVPNDNEAGGITLGTVFRSAVAGTIDQIRWFFPTTLPGVPVQGAIYLEGTQALLATATFSATPNAGTWNTATLNTTVNVSAATNYVVAVWTDSRYVATVGQFNGSSIVNGNLTAPADDPGGVRNGRFSTGGALQFPTGGVGNGYFADIIFEPQVDDTIAPDGITVPITLGEPTLSQTMGVAPDGIIVPITLGNPTLSQVIPPSPLGIDMALQAAQFVKTCLCDAVALLDSPPQHCRYQIGPEGFAGIDLFTDECCEGVAYVSMGDVYPSWNSFPDADIVRQADMRCVIPAWAVDFKLGILRCAPRGTDTRGPTDAEWNAAALLSIADSQALRRASCCVRNGINDVPGFTDQFDKMSVVIGRQSAPSPQGGCMERSVVVTVQFMNCEAC